MSTPSFVGKQLPVHTAAQATRHVGGSACEQRKHPQRPMRRGLKHQAARRPQPSHILPLLRGIWSAIMGNVQSIEKAIEALPAAEWAEVRRWFAEFDALAWDTRIETDVAPGKLEHLAAETLADHRAGMRAQ